MINLNIELILGVMALGSTVIGMAVRIIKVLHRAEQRREENFTNLEKSISELSGKIAETEIVSTRVELLNAIEQMYDPQIVSSIFDRYQAIGGNSYAEERYRQYLEEHTKGDAWTQQHRG